jgi:hypothetical protein
MDEKKKNSISKTNRIDEIGDFWDTHDFTEYGSNADDVIFEVACAVPIELELFTSIEKFAHNHKIKVETLVNLWLQEKLSEQN